MKKELYVGLDVHKEWILVAVAEWGRNGAVQDVGAISNDLYALEKLLARLRKRYGRDVMMRACYEAGPCGFGIARRLVAASFAFTSSFIIHPSAFQYGGQRLALAIG